MAPTHVDDIVSKIHPTTETSSQHALISEWMVSEGQLGQIKEKTVINYLHTNTITSRTESSEGLQNRLLS